MTAPPPSPAREGETPTLRMWEVCRRAARYFRTHLVPGDDADDAMMDFVIYMMRGDYMSRFDPERGSLDRFVGRYAIMFCKRRRSMNARRLVPVGKSHRMIADRSRAMGGRSVDVEASLEVVFRKVRPGLAPRDAMVLDAMAVCHADPVKAARLLRIDRTDVARSMAVVRERAERFGHRPVLRSAVAVVVEEPAR